MMAYGQTGSGKTHTMFGAPGVQDGEGVAFRALRSVARLLRGSPEGTASVEFSFLEVYNEKVYDLLSITEPCARIDVLEQADERGNLFDTITEVPVSSAGEAILVVGRAQAARRARHAAIAALPARSHLLIQVIVEREKIEREKSGRDAIRMLLRGRLLIAGLGTLQPY